MRIVTRATAFLAGLIHPPRRPVCPRCGSTLWKRHGFYRRGQRCLDALAFDVPIQRYRCLRPTCRKTWSEQPPWLSPHRWYGRDVIRQSLDLCLETTTSWRELTALVRAEITGAGRALVWAPWRDPKPGAERVQLSHTTLWRWFVMAAERTTTPESWTDRYAGLFAGVLATDESWGWVKGTVEGIGQKVSFGIQALVDGTTRVVLRLRRLTGESEEILRAAIEGLPALGVPLDAVRVWLSDGLATYDALLAMLDLADLPRQRSVFHLWRTIGGLLAAVAAARGEEAHQAVRQALHAVWDAPSERAAVVALFAVQTRYGADPLVQPILRFVRATFPAATYSLKEEAAGVARTSDVVEWLWRRFKRRMRLVQVFMAPSGADNFLSLFELSVNFHRYQIRRERTRQYPYPGRCPLEIAGQTVEIALGERRRVLSWLDALAI